METPSFSADVLKSETDRQIIALCSILTLADGAEAGAGTVETTTGGGGDGVMAVGGGEGGVMVVGGGGDGVMAVGGGVGVR